MLKTVSALPSTTNVLVTHNSINRTVQTPIAVKMVQLNYLKKNLSNFCKIVDELIIDFKYSDTIKNPIDLWTFYKTKDMLNEIVNSDDEVESISNTLLSYRNNLAEGTLEDGAYIEESPQMIVPQMTDGDLSVSEPVAEEPKKKKKKKKSI